MLLSNYTIHDTHFSNQFGNSGTFLYIYMNSNAKVSSCLFINATATDTGAAISSSSSNIEISDCRFEDLESDVGSLLYANLYTNVNISDSYAKNCKNNAYSGTLKLFESSIRVTNITLDTYSTGGIHLGSSEAAIFNSTFQNGLNLQRDSAIYCR